MINSSGGMMIQQPSKQVELYHIPEFEIEKDRK